MPKTNDPFEEGMSEVKTSWVKWGKIGDFIKGTLVDIREINSMLPGKEGQRVKVYEILAQMGSFHQIDEEKKPIDPPVVINVGEYWTIGGKPGIDSQMRNIKLGRIVGLRFTEAKPSKTKGFNALKVIKIYVGGMDPNYVGQNSADVEVR